MSNQTLWLLVIGIPLALVVVALLLSKLAWASNPRVRWAVRAVIIGFFIFRGITAILGSPPRVPAGIVSLAFAGFLVVISYRRYSFQKEAAKR